MYYNLLTHILGMIEVLQNYIATEAKKLTIYEVLMLFSHHTITKGVCNEMENGLYFVYHFYCISVL